MQYQVSDSTKLLNFSQREGYEDLPSAMRPEELSNDLRRQIFNFVRSILAKQSWRGEEIRFKNPDFVRFLEQILGAYQRIPENHVSTSYRDVIRVIEQILLKGVFNRVLDFLELFINKFHNSHDVGEPIAQTFKDQVAYYRLDLTKEPYHFFPIASQEQGESTQQSLETLMLHERNGASSHLRQAAEHINAKQFSDSIVDSIHAVESVARQIDQSANSNLERALSSLERGGIKWHPALKTALIKLYGYTSDEEGLRHALIERSSADVNEDDAIFMFGACASFAAYLSKKHRKQQECTG